MQRRVDNGRYAISQRGNCPIANGAITELLDSAGTLHQRNTGGVINTELSFKAGLWRFLARELHHQRMYSQIDTIDFVARQFVFISKLNTAVNRRMHHDAAGKGLVRVLGDLK